MLIRFIDPQGQEHEVEGEDGESVMQCATRALIPGIIGECGGALACATCHAFADMGDGVPSPTAAERDMIDGCIDPRPTSRLTCQIHITPALAGATFTVPDSQF